MWRGHNYHASDTLLPVVSTVQARLSSLNPQPLTLPTTYPPLPNPQPTAFHPTHHPTISDITVVDRDTLIFTIKTQRPTNSASGHSFHIGAASTVSQLGSPDHTVQLPGLPLLHAIGHLKPQECPQHPGHSSSPSTTLTNFLSDDQSHLMEKADHPSSQHQVRPLFSSNWISCPESLGNSRHGRSEFLQCHSRLGQTSWSSGVPPTLFTAGHPLDAKLKPTESHPGLLLYPGIHSHSLFSTNFMNISSF
ncbi:hypothetical protein SKAU_G00341680 [Synaphobranchus kaupii]|uniref:Uncharacterized protein n=1 Tax=Synaphobranchus kaupii TaxID=118154 RepID=A0A9Q1EN59_SYNKA|nr:hypothetical protein SKAU_G00341680 [Synaphobranchus kaupii]